MLTAVRLAGILLRNSMNDGALLVLFMCVSVKESFRELNMN